MKLIIDIPEEDYKILKEHILNEDSKKVGFSNLADAYKAIGFPNLGDILARRVINGTPIPDNSTNRDVLKIMFSNGITIDRSTAHAKQFTEDWLNAPYQKGGDVCETNCESCTHYGEDLHGANCRFCHEYSCYERR